MGKELSSILSAYDKVTGKVKGTLKNILDDQSFVELDALIGGANEFGEYKGEGILSGIASINDYYVAVIATNPEVFDGGISKKGACKIARTIDRAIAQNLPIVSFLDTAGARILEGVDALSGYAKVLSSYAKANCEVPVFTVNCSKNYGMLAYLSGCSDLFIAYESSKIAPTSPALLSANSKDGADKSDAKSVAAYDGSITNIVKNDAELKELLCKALSLYAGISDSTDDANRVCAKIATMKKASDVVGTIFDQGSVLELRSSYATEAMTALAKLDGEACAVVYIKDKLTQNSASKISELIRIAECFEFPLITLVDSTGVVVDGAKEQSLLSNSISNLIISYAKSSCAKISLVTGSAIGIAYSIFASKQTSDYSFAWEKANVAPLDGAQAARLFYGNEIAKLGGDDAAAKKFAKVYEDENTVFTAAEKGCFDNVILPEHSRQYLIAALKSL